MQHEVTFRAVVFQEDELVCAQCLEYDFAAQGKSLDDCLYELERLIVGHLAVCVENGLEPFRGLSEAPAKFWSWFEQSKIALRHERAITFSIDALPGLTVQPSEIRVAQPQAA